MYDLETLNQAWFICADESLDNMPDSLSDEEALQYIAERLIRHAPELLRDAARELNAMRDAGLWPRSGGAPAPGFAQE